MALTKVVELYADRLDYELGTNDSAVLFTTARRKASINDGLREFADLTECWVRASTIVCSNGVAQYNLHSTVNVPGEALSSKATASGTGAPATVKGAKPPTIEKRAASGPTTCAA